MPTAKSVKKSTSAPKPASKKSAAAATVQEAPAHGSDGASAKKRASAKAPTAPKTAAAAKAKEAPAATKPAAGHKAEAHKNDSHKNDAHKADATSKTVKDATDKKDAPAKAATKAATADKHTAAKDDHKSEGKKTPTVQKPVFDDKFLEEQRELLVAERAKYLRSAQILKADADALVFEREPGDVQFDEESGEGDTLAVERDFELALSAQARQQVEEIDAALARIGDGTYGICRVSGQPIPKERLRAIPWATERVEYKVGGLGRR
jgi:RNA polymerase-binding transcription factor DksA